MTETAAETGAKVGYQVLDRFGLPTLFALMLFGLLIWVVYIQQTAFIKQAEQNQIKIDLLNQIKSNQDSILHHLEVEAATLKDIQTRAVTWETEHRMLEERQSEILKQLSDGEHAAGGNHR